MKTKCNRFFIVFTLLLACLGHFSTATGQYEYGPERLPEPEAENRAGKFFIAPDFGLMFGTVTRIDVSPALGYYLTNRLSIAIGGRYEFLKDSRQYTFNNYKTHIYGMRAYSELDVIRNLDKVIPLGINSAIFGHIEYEGLSLEKRYFDYPTYPLDGRFWYSTTLIGVGLRQPAGQRAAFSLLFLWDTDTSSFSLYTNPILRMGFQLYF